jgi:hypothetical protein
MDETGPDFQTFIHPEQKGVQKTPINRDNPVKIHIKAGNDRVQQRGLQLLIFPDPVSCIQ